MADLRSVPASGLRNELFVYGIIIASLILAIAAMQARGAELLTEM